MTTSSFPIGIAAPIKHTQARTRAAAIALRSQPLRRGAVREWLPIPAPSRLDVQTAPRKSVRLARSIWLRSERESKGEKLLFSLLAVAAVIGIGYGFSCLLDLVQGWAGFNAGI